MGEADDAEVYGADHAETLHSEGLGDRTEAIVLTRFGNVFDPATKQLTDGSITPDYIGQSIKG